MFCSGAHLPFLYEKDCEYEHNKYVGIGSTVFFTAAFAFMSASYALYTVFENGFFSIFFGFVWACFIFSLDRFIVSTLKKEDNKWVEIWKASPRILLAIMLALIISKPLELKIFEKEIENELVKMQNETEREQNEGVYAKYPQVSRLERDVFQLEEDYKSCQSRANLLKDEANREADGSGGSKIRSMGPIYKQKKKDADDQQKGCTGTFEELKNAQQKLGEERAKINIEISGKNTPKANGLLARIEALSRLSYTTKQVTIPSVLNPPSSTATNGDTIQTVVQSAIPAKISTIEEKNAMWWASVAITLLFIIIELAPLLLKIASEKGNYDLKVQALEDKVKAQEIEEISSLNDEVNTRVKIKVGINENVASQELRDNKRLMNQISDAQLSLSSEIIQIWKQDELAKIRANPAKYVGNLRDEEPESSNHRMNNHSEKG